MDSELLDDLNDLGSSSEDELPKKRLDAPSSSSHVSHPEDMESGSDSGDGADDDEDAYNTESLISLVRQTHSRPALGKLRKSQRYIDHMHALATCMRSTSDEAESMKYAVIEDSPDYQLVVASQRLLQDLEQEKDNNIVRVTELYGARFPELEQLVPNKVSYVRAVQRIGNETDIYNVNLGDFLPSNTVMVIHMTAASTAGATLAAEPLQACMEACAEALALEDDKSKILAYLESRMPYIAPNLCALIGASSAANIIGLAGGLAALSKVPACNVTSIGRDKRILHGMSASRSPAGPLATCDLVHSCPPSLRRRMLKVLSAKVILAARMDSYANKSLGGDPSAVGRGYRSDVQGKIDAWQKPDKARTKRALPVPTDGNGKKHRRGGRRARRFKELFAQTEVGALQNKLSFSGTGGAEEYGDSAMGLDTGMLGDRAGSGRVRVAQAQKKDIPLTKQQRKVHAAALNAGKSKAGGAALVDGLTSSFAITPVHGLELSNGAGKARATAAAANAKWFSESSGFASALPGGAGRG
jgi:U4/U6 small nuclear ribonucleoprotein PRP31